MSVEKIYRSLQTRAEQTLQNMTVTVLNLYLFIVHAYTFRMSHVYA